MNELFTWEILGTYAGAVLATTLVTQLVKGIGFLAKIPTRIISYVIALIVLLATNAVNGSLNWASAGLSIINAVIVSLASNGGFDALTGGAKLQKH